MLLPLLCSLLLLFPAAVLRLSAAMENFSRADLPADFVFGVGTAAYQYEGAAFEDGRTPSFWDSFAHAGRMVKGVNGDVACDGYHKYKEDVGLLADMGLEAFRKDFTEYAGVCFKEFGDRVLHWTTVNEANIFAMGGYDDGTVPRGRCSYLCSRGNSSTEPYLVGHNVLLAHSATARLYKEKYKETQKGYVGFNILAFGTIPYSNAKEDIIATQRFKVHFIGWLIDPLVFGDYPEMVKLSAQTRIPAFAEYEKKQLKGSADFLGVNHYFPIHIKDNSSIFEINERDYIADMGVQLIFDSDGNTPSDQYQIKPSGLFGVLDYLKQVYDDLPVYIHENGQRMDRDGTLIDTPRVKYLHAFIGTVLDSIRDGLNPRGYFVWTFMDCLELLDGYQSSYGLYYVDLEDKELTRCQKLSASWYSNFLKGGSVGPASFTQLGKNILLSRTSHIK